MRKTVFVLTMIVSFLFATTVCAGVIQPKNLLIYYGWLNSFNSSQHGWNNEKVAQEMSKYDLLVFGDGIQSTSHGDWANTSVIVPRIMALNPDVKIFGYVTVYQSFANFKSKVDEWETNLGIHGIFMDEAGYDYGSTTTNGRQAFNDKVDYVHSTDKLCFVNAWKIEHILGNNSDASYPDSTWNPNGYDSNLNEDDWYLLESFCVNTAAYTGSGGYESKTDWVARGNKAFDTRQNWKINLATVGIIADGHASETTLFNFHYTSAIMYELDAVGSANTYYGASDAVTKFIARPDISGINYLTDQRCNIKVHASDSDVYMKYVGFGKLLLDFSSGAQTSSITNW